MKVEVYKNLHKDTWSIRDQSTGLVVDHSDHVLIKDAKFVVQKRGRNRVLKEKRKNVHAFVRGVIRPYRERGGNWNQVKYDPYKADHFYRIDTGEAVKESDIVVMDSEGVWIEGIAELTCRGMGAWE